MSLPKPHDRSDLSRGLARALVGRPITVFMLFLTLIGTGALAYMRIPLTLLPGGLSSSSLSIGMPYPGAGPKEVEDQITRLVEEELRTIPGITEIFSVSSEGYSNINVSFGAEADMDMAYAEVRDRIERVRGMLPPEMDRYRIRRWNSNTDMPVMWIGVQYDADAADPFGPIERIAVPRIEAVDGVAQVGLYGVVDEAIRIFVDIEKSAGYGINLGDVISQMQSDNFTLPAGQIDDGGRTFALRIDARYQSQAEIERYPIGNGLVLSDIAEIVRARAYRDSVWRINGHASVGMDISRESDENTIAVCARLEEVIASLEDDPRLSGVSFNIFWNQKEAILQAVDGLKGSALWGGLFAVIVLMFFLRDIRMTFLAALAIPVSLLAAVMAVYFGGGTLNLISLAGFTLGIGMLVDNAVVVIESIARRRAAGEDAKTAAATGTGDVGIAVLTATLTSVVVFLPLAFMDGGRNTKVLMKQVGLPISWSLLASLLVALVFLPTFAARLMKKRADKKEQQRLQHGGRLERTYAGSLKWVLEHRFGAFLLLMLVVGVAQWCGANLRASNADNGEGDGVRMMVETPSSYTLAETNQVFRNLEGWADEHMEEWSYDFYSANFSRGGGRITFYPLETASEIERDALPDRLRNNVPELPGVKTRVGRETQGGKELRIDLNGPDSDVLADLSVELKDRLELLRFTDEQGTRPLLDIVRTDLDRGMDEVHLLVDRDRTALLGVDPQSLRGMVSWGLGGQRLPDLIEGDREVRVQIEYGQSDEESLEFLRNLGLYTDMGTVVPLSAVTRLTFDKALGALVRRDGRTTMGVSAMPVSENLFAVSREVDAVLENMPFPEGYTWTAEGGREDFEGDMSELFLTLGFSIILVYLLIAILLESVVLPFSILISIVLAMMGVNMTLYITDSSMQVMVGVGMVLLAGIVVNNAILLLDRVQRLRSTGLSRNEALIRGGRDRLHPILMTALTTIFGLMPMAAPQYFPGQQQGSGYEGMAITVAGGLAFSTVFTLLAVPLFYTYFDDLGRILGGMMPWAPRPDRQPSGGSEPLPEGLAAAAVAGGPAPAGQAGLLAPHDDA
jgi:HAE1 family hydrophobic/amphiphilic exporter-1